MKENLQTRTARSARHRGRYHAIALILGISLAISGCTVDEDHDGHADDAAPEHASSEVASNARVIEITGESFAFDPDHLELTAGEDAAIELTATDLEHDFVIDGTDVHIHAEPGETSVGGLRIDEPGTYTAYCSVAGHREAGMTATVVVTS